MNAIILNGGGLGQPFGGIAGRVGSLLEAAGASVQSFDLTAIDIGPCRGCFGCWTKTPGLCLQHDGMDAVLPHLAPAEVVVWLTPVTYGGYGYHLKKALDRSIPIILPFFIKVGGEVHHPQRYAIARRLAVLGVQPSADEESERIFRGLVARNALNMQARPLALVLRDGDAGGPWEEDLKTLLEAEEN